MTDPVDTQISATLRHHAGRLAGGRPDLATIESRVASRESRVASREPRAGAVRRRRALTRAGLGVAAIALTGGVAVGAAHLGGADSGRDEVAATDDATPSAEADPRDVVLEQLPASDAVRQYLFYRTDVPGVVLCGTSELGEAPGAEPGKQDLYVWLECSSYRTGADARGLASGADPAVVMVRGEEVLAVEFPPPHYTLDQLPALFPPAVVEQLRSRPLPVVPDDDTRLAAAAAMD